MAFSKMIKCSLLFPLTLLLLNIICSQATEFLVGGEEYGWKVPPNYAKDYLNQWAAKNRFEIGDTLVWKYNASRDSVLQVTRESYQNCNRTSPVADHKDFGGGTTIVKLERSGPSYFISGAAGACEQGEKLIVVVLSEKHSVHARLAPEPSRAERSGPASAPTSGASEVVAGRKGGAIVVAGAALLALGTMLLL